MTVRRFGRDVLQRDRINLPLGYAVFGLIAQQVLRDTIAELLLRHAGTR